MDANQSSGAKDGDNSEDERFRVLAYSPSAIEQYLDEKSHKGKAQSRLRRHLEVLNAHLEALGSKTIVAENCYIDRDYLEDYAAYYARCFVPYDRTCVRLHFFKDQFDTSQFSEVLLKADQTAVGRLKDSYLGFIVIKPLPSTVVGRTCLRPPPSSGDHIVPVTDGYDVSLFGISLHVDSLAFQEQDSDVAACATSALWSVLHATGKIFQHAIPSPAEITRLATSNSAAPDRAMPNNGLTPDQMCQAIRLVGLEASPTQVYTRPDLLRLIAASYLSAGIPLILIGSLYDSWPPKEKDENFVDVHAIALCGYSEGKGGFQFYRSELITGFIAHDDQIGPYIRFPFDATGEALTANYGPGKNYHLRPELLLVPLYHKIRVPPVRISEIIDLFDAHYLQEARKNNVLDGHYEWTFVLNRGQHDGQIRSEIFRDKTLDPSIRLNLLTRNLPRFSWRAIASKNGKRSFELLFDATDLLQGELFLAIVPWDRTECLGIAGFCSDAVMRAHIKAQGNRAIDSIFEAFASYPTQLQLDVA